MLNLTNLLNVTTFAKIPNIEIEPIMEDFLIDELWNYLIDENNNKLQ